MRVGSVTLGGDAPIRLQSMTNLSTNDVEGCVAQTQRIVAAGGDIVRLTTQGVREAKSAGEIRAALRSQGCQVPIVADVHFNPKAAFEAALQVDKVRINPGNFVDAARTFRRLEFTDAQYAAELDKIRAAFLPFLDTCRAHGVAVRLGVNHGSLSDRIMSRYGDTPQGMVHSVMEYLRIAREVEFSDIVISIKASNTVVMTTTVRLLVQAMDAEDMHFPIHLGVTEAGDGDDGRIKSAVGIGCLLAEGIGDTVRVSLSEEPEAEIAPARLLVNYITSRAGHAPIPEPARASAVPTRTLAEPLPGFQGVKHPFAHGTDTLTASCHTCDASSTPELFADALPVILTSTHVNVPGEVQSWIERFVALGGRNPIVVRLAYADTDPDTIKIKSAADFGTILLNGHASGIWLDAPALTPSQIAEIELTILQACRLRTSKTEFISCPGCGRTLFDLQATLRQIKETTAHLPGLKIGVMGCIVNGPGEMADADYGYVGAARGKVSLYKGKQCVEMNIPQDQALPRLIALIKSCGDWRDPQ